MADYSSSSDAADKVASNSDLLTEILIHLPIRSLMRFKSVSKHWLSLITSDSFSLRRNPDSTAVSGLFLHPYTTAAAIPKLDFIPLTNSTTKSTPSTHISHHGFNDVAFFPGLSGKMRIISSCHGLLLCCVYYKPDYVVLNPTTKEFDILPDCPITGLIGRTLVFDMTARKYKTLQECHISDLKGLTLVFDPSKSPHYKIVCVRYAILDSTPAAAGPHHHIMTYSSETRSWKASSEPFAIAYSDYKSGVYWNGAVHWFGRWGDKSYYYDVAEERVGNTPVPPPQEQEPELALQQMQDREQGICRYPVTWSSWQYGESRGHLHLIQNYNYGLMNRYDVYEMAEDYSVWLLKYRVEDLDGPGIPRDLPGKTSVRVLCVVRTERDEASFMVLHVRHKIFRYVFADGDVKEICDLAGSVGFDNETVYYSSDCHPYIQTLSRVR